jgi:hypothetical protein
MIAPSHGKIKKRRKKPTASAAGFKTVGVYDRYAFEQERLARSSTHYIAKGETLMKLTPFEE